MRVLVCGDRNWTNAEAINRELDELYFALSQDESMTVIHGGCRGADLFAGAWAKQNDCGVLRFAADWSAYGKAAGPIRNRQMLTHGQPDLVLAFHPNLAQSKGTKDMVTAAQKAGVQVRVVQPPGQAREA